MLSQVEVATPVVDAVNELATNWQLTAADVVGVDVVSGVTGVTGVVVPRE